MRLVEQPQPGLARHEHGERGATLLAGGAAANGCRREPTRETEPAQHRADPPQIAPARSHSKAQVLLHCQVLVQE